MPAQTNERTEMNHPDGGIAGRMMCLPLLVSGLLRHAARHHGDGQVVSRRVEGDIHRYSYRECELRSRKLASALEAMGVQRGDRIGTLAWNGYRHLELYYGVGGSGAVVHTMNPRLHPEQIAWIVNDAQDVALAFDATFAPIIQAIIPLCPKVRHWIALCEPDALAGIAAQIPAASDLLCYESVVASGNEAYVWPEFDENMACGLCYTSGTTGNPKGVLYSNRSTVLHAFGVVAPDAMGVSARDVGLPVVPMFHVNAWGLPYAMPMVGAKIVFPGPRLDGASIHELCESEKVTMAAGVPTVWFALLNYLQQSGKRFSTMTRTVIGGSACPPAMIRTFEQDYGVQVIHAWGMTEMSPLGTLSRLREKHLALPLPAQQRVLEKQGQTIFGVDMKIVNDEGQDLPWDGTTPGHLWVRGNWVIQKYFGADKEPLCRDEHGLLWFPTGDIATIDADGYMQITDRSKDVIKSGGEWISSVDLENLAVAHPAVAQAAVVGLPHPKWDERPLLVIVRKPGAEYSPRELLSYFEGKVAKWWIPDDVVEIAELPLGATGKILKNRLREQYGNHQWSGTAERS